MADGKAGFGKWGKNDILANPDFELIIDINQVGQVDETWQQKGTLKLISKDGQTITRAIYGECGC